jgi:hypothetical protein
MSKNTTGRSKKAQVASRRRRRLTRLLLVGAFLVTLLVLELILTGTWPFGTNSAPQTITNADAPLAAFYAEEVQHWRSQIDEWAEVYSVNPNVIAIVIQIESCGDPVAISGAGALGLMQVMPFHFANGENMLNPDTNVRRGMSVFYECLKQFADWDLGLALACYNGGPSVTQRDYSTWAQETQSYYDWATGLWDDVVNKRDSSKTLDRWLAAGGQGLCDQAAQTIYQLAQAPPSEEAGS